MDLEVWNGFNWLRAASSGGYCEHGKESSGAIKGVEFIY
jgi:hypothetical protein